MPLFNKKKCVLRLALASLPLLLSGCLAEQIRPDQAIAAAIPEAVVAPQVAPEAVVRPDPLAHLDDHDGDICAPAADLWDRLRAGFQLSEPDNPRIASDVAWYQRHPGYMARVVERARPYLYLVVDEVQQRDLPTELALLPVVESAYQPFAYSHGRAAGLWQFVPGTGRRFGLKQSWWYDGRRDVAQSTRAALDYLQFLNREFKGDWLLALAAYNSGEGTVMSAIRRNRKRGRPTDFWSLDLPAETRGYVPRLLAISRIVADPAAHGLALDAVDNQPFLAAVDVGSQIDLDLVAELSELSVEEVYRYNPGFNRWATDPDGPHTLLLPIDIATAFEERLSRYPANERISWTRHRIRDGESLGAIADRYRTTVPLIKRVNNIRGNMIRAGDNLVIPVARKDLQRYRLSADQRLASLQKQDNGRQRVDYEVREGDTLWDIAQRYDVGVRTLAQWNGMAPRDTLRPGQRLVIWRDKGAKDESVSAINPVNFNHPMEQKAQQRIGYTVRKGDSLARISQRFRVSVDALKRWNKLGDGQYLQPGQKLTLYVDVTSQSGSI